MARSSTVGKLFLEHFVARSLGNCSRGEGSFGVDALFLGGAAYGLNGWGNAKRLKHNLSLVLARYNTEPYKCSYLGSVEIFNIYRGGQ